MAVQYFSIILLATILISTLLVECTHFYGATVRFKTDPLVENKATFFYKIAWKIDRGACNTPCTVDSVGTYGTRVDGAPGVWKCWSGCGSEITVAGSDYWVTAVNTKFDYEMGENSFSYTFDSAGPFKVGLQSGNWRAITGKTATTWSVLVEVNFGVRSDTKRPNNSPLTASLPIYRLEFDCNNQLQLPLVDPDGDTVRCRWGDSDDECDSVCHALPGVTLDEDNCIMTLTANSYLKDGWYVGALMLEDFPKETITMGSQTYTPDDALSKVPVQFLVTTPDFSTDCGAKPQFVYPTPAQGTLYYVKPTESIGISFYAQASVSSEIVSIESVLLPGVLVPELSDDNQIPTRPRTKFTNFYWTPSPEQSGVNTICFLAVDNLDRQSDYRCVYIYSNDVDECLSSPCQNGGTCNNMENLYTCTCPENTAGYNCQTDTSDDCVGNACVHGTCVDGISTYTCDCTAGYTGTLCDADINECLSSPCLNGGSCSDQLNSFSCSCAAGFTGDKCQLDIDECDNGPCQNTGTCLNMLNEYKCLCQPGYTGTNCETEIDECTSSPCVNGTCTDILNGYTCACEPGYEGLRCSVETNECLSTPCLNNGICKDGINSYSCVCAAGFEGTNCEVDIDNCASLPCVNGECIDGKNSYTCQCSIGYVGSHCELERNDCESYPCEHFSRCTPLLEGYTCNCSAGYEGARCEVDIDECSSNPCMNGGECSDKVNGYTCSCLDGYIGTHCETPTDECVSSPCMNNGTCIDEHLGFTCKCPPYWEGTFCETTNRTLCYCSHTHDTSGSKIDLKCDCAEDFTFNRFKTLHSMSIPCLRNRYLMLMAGLSGAVFMFTVLMIAYCVKGRKPSYQALQNEGETEEVIQLKEPQNQMASLSPTQVLKLNKTTTFTQIRTSVTPELPTPSPLDKMDSELDLQKQLIMNIISCPPTTQSKSSKSNSANEIVVASYSDSETENPDPEEGKTENPDLEEGNDETDHHKKKKKKEKKKKDKKEKKEKKDKKDKKEKTSKKKKKSNKKSKD